MVSSEREVGERKRNSVPVDLLLVITALTGVAALLRIARLDHPVRYDEAFSFLVFSSGDGPSSWFAYTYPNNHILHTLLVHLSTAIGGPGLTALRAPALVAGVLLVPLAAAAAHRVSGRKVDAVIAGLLVGASSILVEYSVNARGYSMVCALTLVMFLATLAIVDGRPGRGPWAAWICAAIAGLVTIPIMLYPIGLFATVITISTLLRSSPAKRILVHLGGALVAAATATVVCYLPSVAISGVGSVAANRFILPQPLAQVTRELPAAVMLTAEQWSRDLGAFVLLIVVGLIVSVGLGIQRREPLLTLPIVAPVLLILAAVVQRVIPFPRVWLFLLPVLLVCAAVGIGEIADRATKNRAITIAILGLVAALSISEGSRVLARDYLISEDTRTLVDAEAIVWDLEKINDGFTALAHEIPSGPSLAYYGMLWNCRPWRMPDDPSAVRTFVVKSYGQTVEEVIEAAPGLYPRVAELRRLAVYPRAEVWEATHKIGDPGNP